MPYGYGDSNPYQQPGAPQYNRPNPNQSPMGGVPNPYQRPYSPPRPQRPQFQRPMFQPATTRPPVPVPPRFGQPTGGPVAPRPNTNPPPPGYAPPSYRPPRGPALPPALGNPAGVPSPVFKPPTSTFGHAANGPVVDPRQHAYDQLAAIDPNVLWAFENTPTPDIGARFGSDEVNLVNSLLPPRLLMQINAGQMSLGGALNRYLQQLRGMGFGGISPDSGGY